MSWLLDVCVRGSMILRTLFLIITSAKLRIMILCGWLSLAIFFNPTIVYADGAGQLQSVTTTVKQTVLSTLETNPRIAEIQQNRTAVSKDLEQTQGRYYPRVDLEAGLGTDQHSDALTRTIGVDNEWDNRTEASIALVQPLYQGGEIRNNVLVQSSKLESAVQRLFDNVEAVALDSIIAHMEVWRQRNLLNLSNKNVTAHQKIVDHIQERQRAGVGSTADVYQANGRLALTRTSLLQTTADLQSALANYYQVVGRHPGDLELAEIIWHYLPKGIEDALRKAEVCNPKLAAFAADIDAAQYEVDARKANFLPRINLELSSTYRNQVEGSQTYEQNNAAMVRARWNLFKGGSDRAARESAVARKRQTLLARNDEYNRIVEQVTDTWTRYTIAGEQIQTYTDAVNYNRQTRTAYQEQFLVGQRSLLDLLDAENELFQSSSQLITSKVNEIIATYRLSTLTGCLIRSLDIDPEQFQMRPGESSCCSQ